MPSLRDSSETCTNSPLGCFIHFQFPEITNDTVPKDHLFHLALPGLCLSLVSLCPSVSFALPFIEKDGLILELISFTSTGSLSCTVAHHYPSSFYFTFQVPITSQSLPYLLTLQSSNSLTLHNHFTNSKNFHFFF